MGIEIKLKPINEVEFGEATGFTLSKNFLSNFSPMHPLELPWTQKAFLADAICLIFGHISKFS